MKRFFLMACVAISMLGFTAKAESVWGGGVDTDWATDSNGYYLIQTAEELAGLASRVNNGESFSGKTFLLMDDINLNKREYWTPIGYVNGMNATGTFNEKRFFSGIFDGQGHTISKYNFKIDNTKSSKYVTTTAGLFGAIQNATICNLTVRDSQLYLRNKHYSSVGGAIVGISENSTITNCSSINNKVEVYTNSLLGTAYAGGVCGVSVSSLSNNVSGFETNNSSEITDCVSVGNTTTADKTSTVSISGSKEGNKEYASEGAMKTIIAATNRATIIYNNWGIGSAPASPFYINETTGLPTNYIYYAYIGIDDEKAQSGSYYSKATISYNDKKIENFEYDGWYYTLYRAGATMNVTFNLNGWSEDKKNTGWYVKEVINSAPQGGELLTAEKVSETEGNSVNNGRYTRTQVYKVTVPSKKFAIQYETRNKSDEWAATNRATILYNNFGEGNAPASPYYIDETTGAATDYIYYMYQGIDDSRALPGTVRKAATVEHGEYKMEFEKDGNTYVLYPAGYPAVTASFYTEGLSGDWSKTGFFVEKAYNKNTGEELEMGYVDGYGNDGYDKEGNATYDETKDCFMRTEEYQITMPEAPLYITYTTQTIVPTAVEDAMNDGMQVYGTRGELVANVATPTHMVVVAIDGRVVYNAIAEGETRIALPAGIYIANNHKVVVR